MMVRAQIVIFWVLMSFNEHVPLKRWYPPTRLHGVKTQNTTIRNGQHFGLWSSVITLFILMAGYSVLKESSASIFSEEIKKS
jgi:hypothetical protein